MIITDKTEEVTSYRRRIMDLASSFLFRNKRRLQIQNEEPHIKNQSILYNICA